MKRFFYFAFLLAFPLLSVSCVTDLEDGMKPSESDETVTLTLYAGADTKTFLSEDRFVMWEGMENIDINDTFYEVVLDENDPTKAYVENVTAAERYVAIYGNAWQTNENSVVYAINPEQQYREGSFGSYENPMAAVSDTTELYFYNLASVLKLGVTGSNVNLKSLSVSGNNGEIMSACYLISYEDLQYNMADVKESVLYEENDRRYKSIIYNCGDDGLPLTSEPQYLYVVVPAQTYEKGFTVTLADSEGRVCVKSTSKTVVTGRSEIVQMADFEFSEAEALDIVDVLPDITSVSYTVTAQPNSNIRTLLVYKSMWDSYANNEYYIEYGEAQLATDILNVYGRTVQVGPEGIYVTTETKAWNRNGYETVLTADTDYIMLVSYADGAASRGEVLFRGVRTKEAAGVAPELNVEVDAVGWNTATVRLNISDDAVHLKWMLYTDGFYEELASSYSDKEILDLYGWDAPGDSFESAKESWCYLNYEGLGQNSACTFLAMATNETGMETVKRVDFTTEYYIDPDATWTVVSETASMDCGFMLDVNNFFLYDLVVEKMDGEDFFRIVDLPKAINDYSFENLGYGIFDGTQTEYFYIDARYNDAVVVELYSSPFRLIGDICYYYTDAPGYYDKYAETIHLSSLMVYHQNDGARYKVNPSVLYLYGDGGGAGEDDNRGEVGTEDFNKNPDEVPW